MKKSYDIAVDRTRSDANEIVDNVSETIENTGKSIMQTLSQTSSEPTSNEETPISNEEKTNFISAESNEEPLVTSVEDLGEDSLLMPKKVKEIPEETPTDDQKKIQVSL